MRARRDGSLRAVRLVLVLAIILCWRCWVLCFARGGAESARSAWWQASPRSPRSPRQAARSRYTAEEIDEVRQAFQVNLPVGSTEKMLPVERLGKVLRSLGRAPTERQLSTAAVESGGEALDFDTVLEAVAAVDDTAITEERAKAAFAFFDGVGNGQISTEELRTLLSTRGEPLPPDQLETWLAQATLGKGYVARDAIVELCS